MLDEKFSEEEKDNKTRENNDAASKNEAPAVVLTDYIINNAVKTGPVIYILNRRLKRLG
jgi:hypothetical protein